MIQILSWFPSICKKSRRSGTFRLLQSSRNALERLLFLQMSVLTFPITFPTNEEFKSTTKEFTVSYVVNFVLLLAFDGDRIRGRRQEPIDFIPFIRRETINMKGVMYF